MGIQSDEFVTQAREHLTVLEQRPPHRSRSPTPDTDVRERVDSLFQARSLHQRGRGIPRVTRPFARWPTRSRPSWKPENEGCLAPVLGPSSGSWRRATAWRRSWMTWKTATGRISGSSSRNWSGSAVRSRKPPRNGTSTFESWTAGGPVASPTSSRRSRASGAVAAPAIDIAPAEAPADYRRADSLQGKARRRTTRRGRAADLGRRRSPDGRAGAIAAA